MYLAINLSSVSIKLVMISPDILQENEIYYYASKHNSSNVYHTLSSINTSTCTEFYKHYELLFGHIAKTKKT